MNSKCPSCNSAITDESAQFCPVCFEVRPAEGWARVDAPGASAPAPGRGPEYTPAFSRKRVQTVVESNIDVDAIVQQAKEAERAGASAPTPSTTTPEPVASNPWGAPAPEAAAPPPPSNDVSGGFGAPAPPVPAPPPDVGGSGKSSNAMVIVGVVVGLFAAMMVCACGGFLFAWNHTSDDSPFGDSSRPEPTVERTSDKEPAPIDEPTPDEEPDKEPEKRDDPPEPTPDREPPADSGKATGAIGELTPEAIIETLERDRWKILSEPSTTSNSTFSSTTISAMKPPKGAAIGLYDYRDASLAKSLEKTFAQNSNAAVRRSGNRVVSVIIPNNKSEAKRVLKLILNE